MEKALDKEDLQYCAFLRGINVGGHMLIKMEELRKTFESLGYKNVKTVLASGNVIFESPEKDIVAISKNIAVKLREISGRSEILVIIRSMEELKKMESRQPFNDLESIPNARPFVTFLSETTVSRGKSSLPSGDGFKVLSVSGGAICSVLYDRPAAKTPELMSFIEKEYGRNVTTRTWSTIVRVLRAADI
jgi:uncharacterized protein (DUF1697 family)